MTRKITASGGGSDEPPKAVPGAQFPGSRTRHGTPSGWSKHLKEGTEACGPCTTAKAHYDWRWRSGDGPTRKNRLRAKAQSIALTSLRRAHEAEYDELYADAVNRLFEEAGYDPPRLQRKTRRT